MSSPWSEPTVGLPTNTGDLCAFAPTPADPLCGRKANWHILGESKGWGLVGMGTCHEHTWIAMSAVTNILAVHSFRAGCAKGECDVTEA